MIPSQSDAQVACTRCGASNPREQRYCARCGAHLYRHCEHCGQRNERPAKCCVKCGQSLKTPLLRRLKREIFGRRRRHLWLNLLLVLAMLLLVLAMTLAVVLLIRHSNGAAAPSIPVDDDTPVKF